ncbi:MAG: prolipoprotein diacylglyceryl transferase [Lachnospiraceae bacterium]|nr:prolipoprotein diacylglyceryl transferase [Lachnospiraceae bacterium]
MAMDLFTIGRFTVHGYGLMIGLGFLVAVLIGSYRCEHGLKLSADHYSSIAIYTLIIGWLGGKLLYLIVEFKSFLEAPLQALGSSGFVVYGGIITGVLTIFGYCKIKKLSFLSYLDALVPCVSICQGFGRLGCFLAGCCYGKETACALHVVFPENSLAPAGVPLIPTQLYSALGNFLLAAIMILMTYHMKRRGDIAVIYFGGYAIGRFVIEFFRDDPRGAVGALTTSQFISILMTAFAIILFLINKKLNLPPSWKEETEEKDGKEEKEEKA